MEQYDKYHILRNHLKSKGHDQDRIDRIVYRVKEEETRYSLRESVKASFRSIKEQEVAKDMIPKDKLEDNQWYEGPTDISRHVPIAKWDKEKGCFIYKREKFGMKVEYDIDYFGDVINEMAAGFAPMKKISKKELEDRERKKKKTWFENLMGVHKEPEKQEPNIPPPDDLNLEGERTGYEYLYEMCDHVRNDSPAFSGGKSPMTERVTYIINQLNDLGVNYKIIPFSSMDINMDGYGKSKMANVQAFFPATKKTKNSIVFTAHHDIANPKSENCQDNTASVCNLIYLCSLLKKMDFRNRNVYVVFTDCEESGGRGASKLCSQIHKGELGKVEGVVSLELTGHGTELWAEGQGNTPLMEAFINLAGRKGNVVSTPYNESMTIRRSGIDSICVGILPKEEMRDIKGGGGYGSAPTWSLCHSEMDTFERTANRKEMKRFSLFLKRFVNH